MIGPVRHRRPSEWLKGWLLAGIVMCALPAAQGETRGDGNLPSGEGVRIIFGGTLLGTVGPCG